MPSSGAVQSTNPIKGRMFLFSYPVNDRQAENPYSIAFNSSITSCIPENVSR